jgi:hypothetical protein
MRPRQAVLEEHCDEYSQVESSANYDMLARLEVVLRWGICYKAKTARQTIGSLELVRRYRFAKRCTADKM